MFNLDVWLQWSLTTGCTRCALTRPPSPSRCAGLKGLFFCRMTRGDFDRLASGLRVASVHTTVTHRHNFLSPLFLVPNRKKTCESCASAACLWDIHYCRTLLSTLCAVWFAIATPNPKQWTQTKTSCCSTGKPALRWYGPSRIPDVNLPVSKLHLIGRWPMAYIGVKWLIQNNASRHINVYSRGDQM